MSDQVNRLSPLSRMVPAAPATTTRISARHGEVWFSRSAARPRGSTGLPPSAAGDTRLNRGARTTCIASPYSGLRGPPGRGPEDPVGADQHDGTDRDVHAVVEDPGCGVDEDGVHQADEQCPHNRAL